MPYGVCHALRWRAVGVLCASWLAACGDDSPPTPDRAGNTQPAAPRDGASASAVRSGATADAGRATGPSPDASTTNPRDLDGGNAPPEGATSAATADARIALLPGSCDTVEDCGFPDPVVRCDPCSPNDPSGPATCYEADCVRNQCAVRMRSSCDFVVTILAPCASDADCSSNAREGGPFCVSVCRDGTDACLPSMCEQGRCVPAIASCGIEHCPADTVAVPDACGGCGLVGGCSTLEVGCFPRCKSADDCGGSAPNCDAARGACVRVPAGLCP